MAKKKTTKKTAKKSTKKSTKAVKKETAVKQKATKPVAKKTTKKPVKEEKPAEKKEELTEEQKAALEEEEKEKQLRIDSFRKAGDIHKQVIKFIKPKVKVGAKLLDICEDIEKKIIELGGNIGFPANICLNDIAAHYSPSIDDDKVIEDGDIVKVDVGVHIEGFVADGAFTVSFNKDAETQNLIMAVETAVLKGLSMIKPGVKTNAVGKATYDIIRGFKYNVIKALNGHSIEQWSIHGGKEIPNVPMKTGSTFEEGEVYALECFASTGSGTIHRTNQCEIFSYDISADRVPLRSKSSRKILGWLHKSKQTLPFSMRELKKEFPGGARFGLNELKTVGKIVEHAVLRESEKTHFVAQFEHTFMVTADGIEQLT